MGNLLSRVLQTTSRTQSIIGRIHELFANLHYLFYILFLCSIYIVVGYAYVRMG